MGPMDQGVLRPLPRLPVLETGHTEIDLQHRELIDDANAVLEQVIQQSGWPKLVAAVERMQRDCTTHFADESMMLSASRYSDTTEHALEHQRILEDIAQIHKIIRTVAGPTRNHWELASPCVAC